MGVSQIPISFLDNEGPMSNALPFVVVCPRFTTVSNAYTQADATYTGAYAVYDAINAAYYPGGDSPLQVITAGYNALAALTGAAYDGGVPIYIAAENAYLNGDSSLQIAEASYTPYISAYNAYEAAYSVYASFVTTYNAAVQFMLTNPTSVNPYSSTNAI